MLFTTHKYLEIELDTKIDLTSATVTKIYYKRPDTTQGQWTATVRDKTKVYYQFTINDNINIEGDWQFQPYVEFNGKPAPGDIVTIKVSKPLTGA